ncbi:DUF4166 domain-containing protein [Ruegeria sp. R13_0]|uniref:DUF4166 domain-containing protein n=1 Tax=Ruegeria sp. R13_0 TaxID=2821099 RepID=UPI001AD9B19E|nr:DUF4166 domain-containing protein [Ruegeria sp. R13_0]MBO9435281.1 DUF4166 domain-containing protein [Ruegeria sp. R13_0]
MFETRDKPSLPRRKPIQTQSDLSSNQDLRFKNLLGAAAWTRLPRAIQRRFSKRLMDDASLAYQGRVTQMQMNTVGRALALALRAIGAPLPFDRTSIGRSAVVTVTEDPATGGQFWIRQYGRAAGFPQMVGSSKRFAGPTGLEEYIGFGIGISLKLESTTNGLYFVSDRYFLKLGQRRVPIPKWAEPGRLVVGHEELGHGQFRFTLELAHPLFGRLIWQDATFQDAEIVRGIPS